MTKHSSKKRAPGDNKESDRTCKPQFLLAGIKRGEKDKLDNEVQEILWYGAQYVVYRTCQGVFVHFADCPDAEARQRKAFNEICPELCELRFLTHEMQRRGRFRDFLRRIFGRPSTVDGTEISLFEHNIAQAIMLLMESDPKPAKAIAKAALAMAVIRSTNDNTIRYVKSSVIAALWAALPLAYLAIYPPVFLAGDAHVSTYFTAALFGVLGAAFSVITRVQSFQMKPCQQSNMNYMMARTRIGIGLVAGLMLYLILMQPLGHPVVNQAFFLDWKAIAVVGFVGGFAERLVPILFQRTAAGLADSSGTPVQAARSSDGHRPA